MPPNNLETLELLEFNQSPWIFSHIKYQIKGIQYRPWLNSVQLEAYMTPSNQ